MKKIILSLTGRRAGIIPAVTAALFFISAVPGIFARDIDLDGIYLSRESAVYKSIINQKFESHKTAGSLVADSGIAYAVWLNGSEAAYIAEGRDINRLMTYSMKSHRKKEIARFGGLVTGLRCAGSGILVLKRMFVEDGMPKGETLWFEISTDRRGSLPGASPFPDFTISPDGQSVYLEKRQGIFEMKPQSASARLVINKNLYAPVIISSAPSLAFFSPEGGRAVVINGSGGQYKGIIIDPSPGGRGALTMTGVSSSSEIYWLDSLSLLYRTGGPGSYTAALLDARTGLSRPVLSGSLNTNISYSAKSKTAAMLDSQMVCLYDARSGELFRSGIEGDDPLVSPDGSLLLTIFQGKLMIGRIDNLKRADLSLRRKTSGLIALYQQAASKKEFHENEYTSEYISKKIRVYEKYTGIRQ